MLEIIPASVSEVTKLVCPHCGEKVSRVGLLKESRVEGLTFKCKKCGMLWEVKSKYIITEPESYETEPFTDNGIFALSFLFSNT